MDSVIIVTIISFILSIVIVTVNLLFKVNVSNKQKEVLKLLPGYNCGACGFETCEGMSKALMKDSRVISKCNKIKEKELESIIKILK